MGADMILTKISFSLDRPGKSLGLRADIAKRFNQLLESLDETDLKHIENTLEVTSIPEAKEIIKTCFDSIFSRETTQVFTAPILTIYTGGISHGDWPTDAMQFFELLIDFSTSSKVKNILGIIEPDEEPLARYLYNNPGMPKEIRERILKYEEAKKI